MPPLDLRDLLPINVSLEPLPGVVISHRVGDQHPTVLVPGFDEPIIMASAYHSPEPGLLGVFVSIYGARVTDLAIASAQSPADLVAVARERAMSKAVLNPEFPDGWVPLRELTKPGLVIEDWSGRYGHSDPLAQAINVRVTTYWLLRYVGKPEPDVG